MTTRQPTQAVSPAAIASRSARHPATRPHIAALALLLAASSLLPACAPLILGGAMVGTALSVADRRTTGAQLEDQSIELKARSRIRDAAGGRGHVNTTSYNRSVLLTGEAATEEDKAAIERAVSGIDNVRGVVNELAVAGASSLSSRASDSVLTSKVKATLIEAKDLQGNVIKVVTERSTVYLMGMVSEREANRATELTRSVGGVVRVVRVFEVLSEAELANQLAPARK